MKTIRIKFVGFWEGFDPEQSIWYRLIKKHYNVELSDKPDYIICSVFGKCYEFCEYPQVRIMYSAENYIPDFNLVDYAISSYPIDFYDRHFSFPLCIANCSDKLLSLNRSYDKSILNEKKYFANFIYSHESEYRIRGSFFNELSKYKRIEAPGTYLNNLPNNEKVNLKDGSKEAFQRKCKFSLCFESTYHEGFVTEKISDAFVADTIPIYFGSSLVKQYFNEKAFINCSDYENWESVIKKIISLDRDDNNYLKMLNEPVFKDNTVIQRTLEELESFLCNIFDQPLKSVFRRSRVYSPKLYEHQILKWRKMEQENNDISPKNFSLVERFIQKIRK